MCGHRQSAFREAKILIPEEPRTFDKSTLYPHTEYINLNIPPRQINYSQTLFPASQKPCLVIIRMSPSNLFATKAANC